MPMPSPVDQDRKNWSKTRPDLDDIPVLYEKEERLAQVEAELEALDPDLSAAIEVAAQARIAWERHYHRWAMEYNRVNSGRTNETSRKAFAFDNLSDDGVPGVDLWETKVFCEAAVEALKTSADIKRTRSSDLQTLVRNLRSRTGLDP